jgi:hypothetical protein
MGAMTANEITSLRPQADVLATALRTLPAAIGAALAEPQARITVAAISRDSRRRLDLYGVDGAGADLVAVTPTSDGEVAVSFPVESTLAEALIVETLGLDAPLVDLGHRSDLDLPALWALAALADAHRQRELEGLLARTPSAPPAIDADAIYLRALDGASMPDPRWLSGLLTQLVGPGDVTEARIGQGLAALARNRLVAEQAGLWSPQPDFVAAFAHLQVPLAGVRLAVDVRHGDGIKSVAMILLRSLASLWAIDLPAAAPPSLSAVTGAEARHIVQAIIAAALTVTPRPARHCGRCGQTADAASRFCGRCGAALG